jgi:cytochrome c
MGCRNPFRIAIDQKKDWLYWGDVGPDAGKDGEKRGPKGYDEINLARKAGYYGWPYFRGDGKIYYEYDFVAEKSLEPYDPEHPINNSPNNTGLQELPPFNKSLIWYSYDESEEFPWVKTGGKNPMAGPVYYSDQYAGEETRYPDYFDGKLFVYEWMRDWIFVVHQDEEGNYIQADPFVPGMEMANPIDMMFGPDGNLYVLEYGETWYGHNQDARFSRIEYVSGNRNPIARISTDKSVGAAPLTVAFSAGESEDLDREDLTYAWTFEGASVQEKTEDASYTFETPGIYQVKLTVTDESGHTNETTAEIQVGNEPPQIVWNIDGNETFYWDNGNIKYQVAVTDKEDGSTEAGTLDASKVKVSIDYLPEGYDVTQVAMGHQTSEGQPMGKFAKGQQLIDGSDCKACHAIDRKVNGPSYLDISKKYAGQEDAVAYLADKIIKGGGGVWGETVMAAHPQLNLEQTSSIAEYILSLAGSQDAESAFPVEGTFVTNLHKGEDRDGAYILMATYSDQGNGDIKPITSQEMLVLRYPRLEAERYSSKSNNTKVGTIRGRNDGMLNLTNNQYLAFADIDLTGIDEITLDAAVKQAGKVELHLDSSGGELAGEAVLTTTGEAEVKTFRLTPSGITGKHDLYFVFKNTDGSQVNASLDGIGFSPGDGLLSAK